MDRVLDARGKLGAIIGHGGSTVRRIQQESGAVVDKLQESGEVRVRGTPGAVAAAVRLIEDLLERA